MTGRPFLTRGVAELEKMFARGKADRAVLEDLRRELGHRTVPRARALLTQVEAMLRRLPDPQTVLPLGPSAGGGGAPPVAPPQPPASPEPSPPAPSSPPSVPATPPPPIPLSAAPPSGGAGSPGAILSAWTALEALDPQTFQRPQDLAAGDRRRVVELGDGVLPWPEGRSIPNHRLFYQVPLGTIPMGPASQRLMDTFGADAEFDSRERKHALLAAVLVDKSGVPVEENGVGVSSFAWALPRALDGKLDDLGTWTAVEFGLTDALSKLLIRRDREGAIRPLDRRTIEDAFEWLIGTLGLDPALARPPDFALKLFHHLKARGEPELPLLNSFYLRDLSRARTALDGGSLPAGLRRYLGIERPGRVRDLLADPSAREAAVAPGLFPPARWPAPGGHPLVLLQQAAVNLARSELAEGQGLFAVNGPPGTGKTTLLRDVVAACVCDRALAMAQFDDPADAFRPSGQKISVGGKAFLHLYRLDLTLKGHEVLVASSNNKAVENVSRELPTLSAVGREVRYLKTLSDGVFARMGRGRADEDDGTTVGETWGMIAAVLGNAANRGAFAQSFWWDGDTGLRAYLRAVRGDADVVEIKDPSGRVIERRTPRIAREAPTPSDIHRNWQTACRRFRTLHAEVNHEIGRIEAARRAAGDLPRLRDALASAAARRPGLVVDHEREGRALAVARQARAKAEHELQSIADRQTAHRQEMPNWLVRLLGLRQARVWTETWDRLVALQEQGRASVQSAIEAERAAGISRTRSHEALARADAEASNLQGQISALETSLKKVRAEIGERFVDDAFFSRGHARSNLAAPWLPDVLHAKREILFEAAMAVHRAFLDGAAQKMQHNLGALLTFLQSGTVAKPEHRQLLPDLWSSLFAVVPVVSTTFASVDRMLGDVPPRAFGWLLIDEAGQAVPQAAVGALSRAKRAIVVGDPLQIPPVVSLPETLVHAVCAEFGVDASAWAGPEASVQTLADVASSHQAAFRGSEGPRRVGAPLLVHRRCQNPMFEISNRIAYDGQMVHAPAPRAPGPIEASLGASRWFHVEGTPADRSKWCPEEGDLAVRLLRKLATDGITHPDLFVISPFRDVAYGLRERFRRDNGLLSRLKVDAEVWLYDRVGTIHTAQGREAEAVILVLGAPGAGQGRVRAWAAGQPNILNVAVSRAKQSLYVIGSHGAWSGVGHAGVLARRLRVAGGTMQTEEKLD